MRTQHLSPWKGGGFGMFSTNDHGGFRSLRVFAVVPAGEQPLPVPDDLFRLRRRVLDLPTRGALLEMARGLAREAPDAEAIRVEVWTTRFSPDDLRPRRLPLRRVVLDGLP